MIGGSTTMVGGVKICENGRGTSRVVEVSTKVVEGSKVSKK